MDEQDEKKIIETFRLIYGNRTDELLDDLRFLHEYRRNMRSMGGWVMRATVTAFVVGLAAAAWAGIKLMVTK